MILEKLKERVKATKAEYFCAGKDYYDKEHRQNQVAIMEALIELLEVKEFSSKQDVSGRSELLFAFRDYWKKSKHQNIDDAIKGFMKTKKGKQ